MQSAGSRAISGRITTASPKMKSHDMTRLFALLRIWSLSFCSVDDFPMPQIFKIGAYTVFFWANENAPLEPIHVHVAERANQKRNKDMDYVNR